jgi:hypothetical protein
MFSTSTEKRAVTRLRPVFAQPTSTTAFVVIPGTGQNPCKPNTSRDWSESRSLLLLTRLSCLARASCKYSYMHMHATNNCQLGYATCETRAGSRCLLLSGQIKSIMKPCSSRASHASQGPRTWTPSACASAWKPYAHVHETHVTSDLPRGSRDLQTYGVWSHVIELTHDGHDVSTHRLRGW